MNFHSLDYLLFLPLAIAGYFATPARWRWVFLLAASFVFYASWRIEYVPVLCISILVDYFVSRAMPRHSGARLKALLALSLTVNLGLLFFFKFVPPVVDGWNTVAPAGGFEPVDPVNLLLPLGISFYTFQTLGYVIDVYRGRRKPEQHLGYFAVYVTFFPQLIAGPIERPAQLLPQLHAVQKFEVARLAAGCALMLIGYFKKLVIADAMPDVLFPILAEPSLHQPLAVLTGALGIVYYYYADLSGYADIAIGTALILGMRLSKNFNRPFAAASVQDFWQRWHVTVSRWFRDYLYLPFGRTRFGSYGAIYPTMLAISLWHDASLNWAVMGLIAATLISVDMAVIKYRAQRKLADAPLSDSVQRIIKVGNHFVLWSFLAVLGALISVNTLADGVEILRTITDVAGYFDPDSLHGVLWLPPYLIAAIIGLEVYQWLDARKPVFERFTAVPVIGSLFYLGVLASILVLGVFSSSDFLYFRL